MNEFSRFAADLARAAQRVDVLGNAAVGRVGNRALDTARKIAPKKSGALSRGLAVRRSGSRAVVEVTKFYAAFQEYGTSRMAPNPFIGPAFDRHAPELVRQIERVRDDVTGGL